MTNTKTKKSRPNKSSCYIMVQRGDYHVFPHKKNLKKYIAENDLGDHVDLFVARQIKTERVKVEKLILHY